MKALFITADGLEVLKEIDDDPPRFELAMLPDLFATSKKWQVDQKPVEVFSRTYERIDTIPLAIYREKTR